MKTADDTAAVVFSLFIAGPFSFPERRILLLCHICRSLTEMHKLSFSSRVRRGRKDMQGEAVMTCLVSLLCFFSPSKCSYISFNY